jgi:hypothetical protein
VLQNTIVAMIWISTLSFMILSIISSYAFAQNDCSVQDDSTCAQSDLSLPVPSENDIAPGLQQQPGEQPRDSVGESLDRDEESQDSGADTDENTFLLPFP